MRSWRDTWFMPPGSSFAHAPLLGRGATIEYCRWTEERPIRPPAFKNLDKPAICRVQPASQPLHEPSTIRYGYLSLARCWLLDYKIARRIAIKTVCITRWRSGKEVSTDARWDRFARLEQRSMHMLQRGCSSVVEHNSCCWGQGLRSFTAPNPSIGISSNPVIPIRYKHLTLFVTVNGRSNGSTKSATHLRKDGMFITIAVAFSKIFCSNMTKLVSSCLCGEKYHCS